MCSTRMQIHSTLTLTIFSRNDIFGQTLFIVSLMEKNTWMNESVANLAHCHVIFSAHERKHFPYYNRTMVFIMIGFS